MSLKDLIAADVTDVFLNTGEFADEGHTFYPYSGDSREITAVVEVEQAPVQEGQSHRTRTESCLVHCQESETEGIGSPQIRDAFLIAGDDAEIQKWDFDTVQRREGGMITCRFTRKRIDRRGGRTPNDL